MPDRTIPGLSYKCPFCQTTTHHPRDCREHYCSRCSVFATDVLEAVETVLAAPQPSPALGIGTTALISLPVSLAVQALNVILGPWAVRHPILQEHMGNVAPMVKLPLPILRHARLLLHNATIGAL